MKRWQFIWWGFRKPKIKFYHYPFSKNSYAKYPIYRGYYFWFFEIRIFNKKI